MYMTPKSGRNAKAAVAHTGILRRPLAASTHGGTGSAFLATGAADAAGAAFALAAGAAKADQEVAERSFRFTVMDVVLESDVQFSVMLAGDACTVAQSWTAARSELVCAQAPKADSTVQTSRMDRRMAVAGYE